MNLHSLSNVRANVDFFFSHKYFDSPSLTEGRGEWENSMLVFGFEEASDRTESTFQSYN